MAKTRVDRRDLRNFPSWLHAELVNWAHWCWQGEYPHPLPATHCASFEHHYRSHEATCDDARPIPPNVDRARIVDRVWRGLPDLPRQVLRAEYPQFHESGRAEHGRHGAARWLKISLGEYEAALFVAVNKVWMAFE